MTKESVTICDVCKEQEAFSIQVGCQVFHFCSECLDKTVKVLIRFNKKI